MIPVSMLGVSTTSAGRVAMFVGDVRPTLGTWTPPTYCGETDPGEGERVACILGYAIFRGRRFGVTQYPSGFAAAAWRIRAGRDPWPTGSKVPKTAAGFCGRFEEQRRVRDSSHYLATELLRVAELEAASLRAATEILEAHAAGDQSALLFDRAQARRLMGIERLFYRIEANVLHRRFPRVGFDVLIECPQPVADVWGALDIEPTADAEAIKAAFKRAALRHHPDRGGDPAAFMRAKRAYDLAIATVGGGQ